MLEHFYFLREFAFHYVNFFFQLNLEAATAALHQIVLSRKVQSVSLAPVVTERSQML